MVSAIDRATRALAVLLKSSAAAYRGMLPAIVNSAVERRSFLDIFIYWTLAIDLVD